MMISFIKNILTPKKNNNTEIVTDRCNHQLEIEAAKTTDPSTMDDRKSEKNFETDVAKQNVCSDSVSKSSESSIDWVFNTGFETNLNPRVVLTDCVLTSQSNRLDSHSHVHKSNGYLINGRRSQRKSAKVAAERIAQITEVCDSSLPVIFNREPSQRLCAKLAVRKIADIIDGSSSESEEDKDVREVDENE